MPLVMHLPFGGQILIFQHLQSLLLGFLLSYGLFNTMLLCCDIYRPIFSAQLYLTLNLCLLKFFFSFEEWPKRLSITFWKQFPILLLTLLLKVRLNNIGWRLSCFDLLIILIFILSLGKERKLTGLNFHMNTLEMIIKCVCIIILTIQNEHCIYTLNLPK